MSATVSPLAPQHVPDMPEIPGVRLATGAAGIKYQGRTDVLFALFDKVKDQLETYVVRRSQVEMITKLRQEAKIERLTPPAAPAAPAAPPAEQKK